MDNNNKEYKKPVRKPGRRKVCSFCQEKVSSIDYKDTAKFRKYLTESGKILPARMTGTCAKHQRELSLAVKRARQMALIAYVED